jgi:hypothetical protein
VFLRFFAGTAGVSATERTQRIDGYAARRLQHHLPSPSTKEIFMKVTNHVTRIALALGLSAASVAFAQTLASTDIYSTNFQKANPKSEVMVASKVAPLVAGSTDIYATNFQRLYASRNTTSTGSATRGETASTDIYFTNFQRRYF